MLSRPSKKICTQKFGLSFGWPFVEPQVGRNDLSETLPAEVSLQFCLHWQHQLHIKTWVDKKESIPVVPLTLMGSNQALNCAGPQNSSRPRTSPALHSRAEQSSQTQPKSERHKGSVTVQGEGSSTAGPRGTAGGNSWETSTPRKCFTDGQFPGFAYSLNFLWEMVTAGKASILSEKKEVPR